MMTVPEILSLPRRDVGFGVQVVAKTQGNSFLSVVILYTFFDRWRFKRRRKMFGPSDGES
jgi:hypothetical protein